MNCPKCGEELQYSADYCEACGFNLKQEQVEQAKGSRMYSVDEDEFVDYSEAASGSSRKKHKKKKKRSGRIVSIILTLSMILVLVLVGFFVYNSIYKPPYEREVDDFVQAVNKREKNRDEWMNILLPEFLVKDLETLERAGAEEAAKDYTDVKMDANVKFSDYMDTLYESFGNDFEIKYKVSGSRKLGSGELEQIEKSYEQASQLVNIFTQSGDSYKDQNKIKSYEAYTKLVKDLVDIEVSEGYEMDVQLTLEGSSFKNDTQELEVVVIKVGDEWMIDYMHDLDRLSELLAARQMLF